MFCWINYCCSEVLVSFSFKKCACLQDYGCFFSPGDKSGYDALGWIKQIGEHTASEYANALEVLENETPRALPKGASGNDQENNDPDNQPGNHSTSPSNALVKLDL